MRLRLIIALAILVAAPTAAEGGCPTKAVAEEGGQHRCYDAGRRGHVHLWTPDGYDRSSAVTVVYIHGHNLGVEGCANAHYLDCAWDVHGLAAQFAASGLNALFVAIEGPVNDRQKPKWASLDDLLASLRRNGARPPSKTVAIAHSAGIFTVMKFLDDDRLAHLVALDALYLDSPLRITRWFRGSRSRRLTLVGADAVHARTSMLGRKLGCAALSDMAAAYPRAVRCVAAVDAGVGHMDVVQGGRVIPRVLARMKDASAPKKRLKPKKKPLRRRKTAR